MAEVEENNINNDFSSKSTNLEAIFSKIFSTCLSDPKLCSEDNYNCALRHCMLLYGPGLPKLLSTSCVLNISKGCD